MAVNNRAPVGTYEYDPLSGYVSPSFALCEILGAGADAHLTVDAFLAFVHAADREHVHQAIRSTERADNAAFVCRIVRPDGGVRQLVHRSEPIRNLNGDVILMLGLMCDITSSVREWEHVRSATGDPSRFRAAFEGASVPLLVTRDTVVLDANQAFLQVTGRTREELIGQRTGALGLAEPVREQRLLRQFQEVGRLEHEPVRFALKGDRVGLAMVSSERIALDGEPAAVSVFVDATARLESLSRLVESEERFRRLSDASMEGLAISHDGVIVDCNQRLAAMIGYTVDELRGRPTLSLIDPSSLDEVRDSLSAEQPAPYVVRLRHRRGGTVTLEANARYVLHDGQRVRLTSLRDLSERARAAEAIRARDESDRVFRQLAETYGDGVVLIEGGRIVYASARFAEMLGRDVADIVGSPIGTFTTAESADVVRYMHRERIEDPYLAEFHRADGTLFTAEINARNVETEDRYLRVANIRDVTPRRRAEERRRALVAGTAGVSGVPFFRSLVKHLASALQVKHAWVAEYLGDPPDRVRALSFWQDKDYGEPFDCALAGTPCERVLLTGAFCAPAGVAQQFPSDEFLRDNSAVSYYGMPLLGSNGERVGLLAVVDDRVMERDPERESILSVFAARASVELQRIRAEEEIRRLNAGLEERVALRTAELEAANKELEAFSYSVSHDLRAPLRHISGFAELLESAVTEGRDAEARELLLEINEASTRMATLIDSLLNLSRLARIELKNDQVGLQTLAEDVIAELASESDSRRVRWTVGSFPPVRGDRGLLRQVLANLLGNAVKYSRTRDVAEISITAVPGAPNEVVCCVADNGVGFDMKYAGKLFGVFQRLHASSEFEGTGIGLANVHRIVTKHGGRVWAESVRGQGARFFFALPAATPIASRDDGDRQGIEVRR